MTSVCVRLVSIEREFWQGLRNSFKALRALSLVRIAAWRHCFSTGRALEGQWQLMPCKWIVKAISCMTLYINQDAACLRTWLRWQMQRKYQRQLLCMPLHLVTCVLLLSRRFRQSILDCTSGFVGCKNSSLLMHQGWSALQANVTWCFSCMLNFCYACSFVKHRRQASFWSVPAAIIWASLCSFYQQCFWKTCPLHLHSPESFEDFEQERWSATDQLFQQSYCK